MQNNTDIIAIDKLKPVVIERKHLNSMPITSSQSRDFHPSPDNVHRVGKMMDVLKNLEFKCSLFTLFTGSCFMYFLLQRSTTVYTVDDKIIRTTINFEYF